MKLSTNTIVLFFVGLVGFAVMACFPITLMSLPLLRSDRNQPVDAIATFQAIVTQTASAPTQYVPTPVIVTATPIAATSTPVRPTNTPVPTAISYCDWVAFVKDVSIPDGSKLYPGETFTKTWRLQNRGTCSWTPDYMLVFTGGEAMGTTTAVRLPGNVNPGQTVDVSVTLAAPEEAGSHTGYWMLRNSYGVLFGTGATADDAFYVQIRTRAISRFGTITGNLSYPSEFIPAMRVAALSLTNGKVYWVDTAKNQAAYAINVPPGNYYVVSYPYQGNPGATGSADSWVVNGGTLSGAYTKAVTCGLTVDCNDHSLVPVVVEGGQAVAINPGDWYAPDGSFPPMPQ